MVWPHMTSGHYSTKSGYRCLYDRHRHCPPEQGSPPHLHKGIHIGKLVWNLDHPECTKVLIVKKEVSTHIHHIHPTCPLCSFSVESMAHLFLQCQTTKPVWANTTFLPQGWTEDSHFKDWNVELTFTSPNKDQFYHFVSILWAIWKLRNELFFRLPLPSPYGCCSSH